MKIARKLISALLSVVLLFTMVVPAFAASNNNLTATYQLSSTNSLEIKYNYIEDSNETNRNSTTKKLESFTVSQYYNGKLFQTVSGTVSGDRLLVTNYDNGIPTGKEIIYIADRVQQCDSVSVESFSQHNTRAGQTQLGHITYKPTVETGTTHRIRVYSEKTASDMRSRIINGKATDTVSIIVGIIISVLAAIFFPVETIAGTLASCIITGVGGSLVGKAIGVAFSEPVAVYAHDYTLTGYDYSTGRYTLGYDGTANQVKTVNGNYYNEWFYDGFTPDNWKHNSLAYWFWCDLFSETYPQVKSYT